MGDTLSPNNIAVFAIIIIVIAAAWYYYTTHYHHAVKKCKIDADCGPSGKCTSGHCDPPKCMMH